LETNHASLHGIGSDGNHEKFFHFCFNRLIRLKTRKSSTNVSINTTGSGKKIQESLFDLDK